MNAPFRLALIGIDHPHGAHWRELLSHFSGALEVAAMVPEMGGGLTSLEERWADCRRFASLDELLAWGEFDGAWVTLPSRDTPRALECLAKAGKHLLSEKPCGVSAEAFRPAARAIDEAGIAFQTGYLWRYDPLAARLRRMVADRQFGQLISVEMSYVTSDVARRGPAHYLFSRDASGGGFFHWLACHYLDLLRYIVPVPIRAVTARIGNFGATPTEVDDGGTAILELASGAIVTFTGGYWLPRWKGENSWAIRGSQRWVHWEPTRPGTGGALSIHGPQPQWHALDEEFLQPTDSTPGYGGRRGVDVVADWLRAARTPGHRCRNTTRSTLATLEVLDAIERSSRDGVRVPCQIADAEPNV